jgi:flagellar assembly factor FliW
MQLINTIAFGEQSVDPETFLHFPEGIAGFEDCTRFKLFHEDGGEGIVHWLQSADREDLSLSVADPAQLGIGYDFALDDRESTLLGLDRPEDALVLIVLYREPEHGRVGGAVGAPLVINVKSRKGFQKILQSVEPGALLSAPVQPARIH